MFRGLTEKQSILDGICILLCAAALIWVLINYQSLPERIPTNFTGNGQISGYSAKSSVFLLLGLMWVMTASFSLLTRCKTIFKNMNLPWKIPDGKEQDIVIVTKDFLCISNLCVTFANGYLICSCLHGTLINLLLWAPYGILAGVIVWFLLRLRQICKNDD